jgi:putative DNA primase/helicase
VSADRELDIEVALASIRDLPADVAPGAFEEGLRKLRGALAGADKLCRTLTGERLHEILKPRGLQRLAVLVDATCASAGDGKAQGRGLNLKPPTPWPDPVDGAALITGLAVAVRRFVAMGEAQARAVALWILHAHALEAAQVSPILAITAPTKRAGKSTLLLVLAALVPKALPASNVSAAALFRAIDQTGATLLIDELDSQVSSDRERGEALRNILNASHVRALAWVLRVQGDDHEPARFSTWAAKAVALIGRLPDTLADRSIEIALRRRRPDEVVERARADRLAADLGPLLQQAARWAADALPLLAAANPPTPDGLHDRAQDNWRPLLAIADQAGGPWPAQAREAASALAAGVDPEEAHGVMLLEDLRDLFVEKKVDKLGSEGIVEALRKRDDRPWPEMRDGKPITTHGVARLLRPFEVRPTKVRLDAGPLQGYRLEDFDDAFSRYLDAGGAATPPPKWNTWNNTVQDGEKPASAIRNKTLNVPLSEGALRPVQDAIVPGVPDGRGGYPPSGANGTAERLFDLLVEADGKVVTADRAGFTLGLDPVEAANGLHELTRQGRAVQVTRGDGVPAWRLAEAA